MFWYIDQPLDPTSGSVEAQEDDVGLNGQMWKNEETICGPHTVTHLRLVRPVRGWEVDEPSHHRVDDKGHQNRSIPGRGSIEKRSQKADRVRGHNGPDTVKNLRLVN